MARSAVGALNGLAEARAGRPLRLHRPGHGDGSPSGAQSSILGRVPRRVEGAFPAPDDFDAKGSLFLLMKRTDMRKVGDVATRAPMSLERLKIMKGDTAPKDAPGLVGESATSLLADPGRRVERPPDLGDSRGSRPKPYMYLGVRGNSPMMHDLVRRLRARG